MRYKFAFLIAAILLAFNTTSVQAQGLDNELGAWYMYFWSAKIKGKMGMQGDYQYRNRNLIGDHEQLLLRTGFTYSPYYNLKLIQGYAFIANSDNNTPEFKEPEHRIYQEAILINNTGHRLLFQHRFRLEERWVYQQNFRTRFRYNLFLNIPFNGKTLSQNVWYLALYNELFINGQRRVTSSSIVEYFDRNRLYAAIGYGISDHLRIQFGIMNQTTNSKGKNQLQLSLHQNFDFRFNE